MAFDFDAFMRDWRASRDKDGTKIKQAELDLVMAAIKGTYAPNVAAVPADGGEPAWVRAGRSKIGEREIPGARHNPWIISFWKQAPWIKTDDADGAWCGGFVKWCLEQAGLPFPKNYPSAKSFATWGTPCKAQVGAIGVKARKGGNHVFLIVGMTRDRMFYKALGGNQNNQVSIIDIRVADVDAIRWPAGAGDAPNLPLPLMAKGTVGASEG